MRLRRRAAAMAVALSAALAGTIAAVASAAATGQHPVSRVAGLSAARPTINWDSPLPGGKASSAWTARADGRLPFSPDSPQFGVRPALVQVTSPASAGLRAIAYVYHFPAGSAFPVDGRVRVLEYQVGATEEHLEAVAANPPGPAADFTVIRVNGHGALLVHANGIGRVQFILHGVMYDVTGPAVSPQEAERLASEIRPA
jgi:hypothetical protein